ncbi:2-polyprenyl-3-methyl-5-hydroxy-6-metoxy-1,4-benzoquinol methylase [Agromyces hippuratus]|uniref:2-polyprenyl-3-methyl-5-hydroxy-6-metoxy-1, 4-benzoquinol methylase n=1 Tax=Agromyces hippuratus TaxID=286438 RepID=A0A852WPK2_9MICO|nr:class I SAM-dependent methyltransferase [Agromyces hippuratus]NYG19889.1 2-polyprenyl-3-methyl-5-hydroxy-6-metoxy-1,4-benzoquinol methylase [Agromyces hippuratus]
MSDAEDDGVESEPTAQAAYAERLRSLERRGIRRVVDVQAPYRWNLRRLHLGRVLDVGCGLGRNLVNLGADSVGVDHNAESIRIARERGLAAYTPQEFADLATPPASFDTLLYAHVLEHMDTAAGLRLIREYLPYLREDGRLCVITPQERGYRSDATHVRFVDFASIREVVDEVRMTTEREFSFPFPRFIGRVFPYNEFVVVAGRG